jgi:hypothetical protein
MTFTVINELVSDTRCKIDELQDILNVLILNYREASEIIKFEVDPREIPLQQLIELNETIGEIVDTHPAIHIHKVWQNATSVMVEIASGEFGSDKKDNKGR